MLAKTRRKCFAAGSVTASPLLTVLASMSVSRTFSGRRGNIYTELKFASRRRGTISFATALICSIS